MPFLIVALYIFLTCVAALFVLAVIVTVIGLFLELYDRIKIKKRGKK